MAMSDARPSGFEWDVGSAISTALSTVLSNVVAFVGLALLIGIPGLLLTFVGLPQIVQTIVNLVLGQIVTITLIYGTIQSLRGQKVAIGECLSQGLSRLPATIVVAILAGIGIGFGLILLIVPGLFLMTLWAAAIPAAVIENTGIGASFTRSSNLTEGRRWRVFGAIVVSWIVTMVITVGITFALVGMAAGGGGGMVIFFVVLWLVGGILQAYMSALSAVLYYFLRRDKEGADIQTIGAVFD